jgi:hypothetical protein
LTDELFDECAAGAVRPLNELIERDLIKTDVLSVEQEQLAALLGAWEGDLERQPTTSPA